MGEPAVRCFRINDFWLQRGELPAQLDRFSRFSTVSRMSKVRVGISVSVRIRVS